MIWNTLKDNKEPQTKNQEPITVLFPAYRYGTSCNTLFHPIALLEKPLGYLEF